MAKNEPKATDPQSTISESELNKVEEATMNAPEETTNQSEQNQDVKPLEEYTVKQLQAMATGEGVFQAEAFTTKQQLIALITNIRSMKAVSKAQVVTMFNPAQLKVGSYDQKKIDESWEKKRDRTREALLKGPKGSLMIPLDVGEKRGTYMPVIINGWRLDYLKGVMHHDVPKPIIDIISESLTMTAEAGHEYMIDSLADKIDPVTGAPKDPSRLGMV